MGLHTDLSEIQSRFQQHGSEVSMEDMIRSHQLWIDANFQHHLHCEKMMTYEIVGGSISANEGALAHANQVREQLKIRFGINNKRAKAKKF